jgi:hypothetical protein
MARLSRQALVAAAVLGLVGCSLIGGGQQEGLDDELRTRELTLVVKNDNFYDATLYALGDSGYRRRLGTVNGNQQGTFRFRWPPTDLRVEIDLLSVGSYTTHALPVDEGDELELRIEPDLHRKVRPPR